MHVNHRTASASSARSGRQQPAKRTKTGATVRKRTMCAKSAPNFNHPQPLPDFFLQRGKPRSKIQTTLSHFFTFHFFTSSLFHSSLFTRHSVFQITLDANLPLFGA